MKWDLINQSTDLKYTTIMDYSPWSEREIWPFLRVAISPKQKRTRITKIGVHACDINPYLHEFFEPILID